MQTVNEELRDSAISHAVDFAHYNNGVVRRIIAILNRVDADLFAQLTAALDRLPAESFTVERLDSLLQSVRSLNASAYQKVHNELGTELKELVSFESGYQLSLFRNTLPVSLVVASVSVEQVYAAAMSRPFAVSKNGAVPLNEYLSGLEAGRAAMIRDTLRRGYIENQTIDQMVRTIRGTRALQYEDGLMNESRRYIEGMVRTATNHVANFTRQRFYEANETLVKKWMFVATLDSRTSITCASLSGKTFPIGQGPQPPRHINCRSTSSPVVASWRELGIDLEEMPASTRASMDGQVPADITFTQWLRGKSASVQDDILGATRGRLFRTNEIEIDRFTDNKGRVLTLDNLRQKHAAMFTKAGL